MKRRGHIMIALIVLGVAMRLWQYLANPSLWLDEILLGTNVIERSLSTLLVEPLADAQVAPKGFLLVERTAVWALGPSDFALRLFPVLCGILSLVVFWRVAIRVLDGIGPEVAVTMFALAVPLIAFSSQAKQYATDVAMMTLLLWIGLDCLQDSAQRRSSIRAAAIGAGSVWLSQPAILVLSAISLTLVAAAMLDRSDRRRRLSRLVPVVAVWSLSGAAALVASLSALTPSTRGFMMRFWSGAFPPVPLGVSATARWLFHQVRSLIGTGGFASLGYPYSLVYVALAIAGSLILWYRRSSAAALITVPICAAVAAAVVRQYPFGDRLVLFLIPNVLLCVAAGTEDVRERLSKLWPMLSHVSVVLLVVPALYPLWKWPPVYQAEDIKPVLSRLETARRSGDGVYVFWGALPAMTFYGPQYELPASTYLTGKCHRGDNRKYFDELDGFRGRSRLWIVMTHALPEYRERDDILNYLDTIGTGQRVLIVPPHTMQGSLPAELFLYDLSNEARLRRATSDSFPTSGPVTPEALLACS